METHSKRRNMEKYVSKDCGLLSNHLKAWTCAVNSQTSKLSQPAVRLFVVGSNATLINACRTMPGTQRRDG